MANISLMLPLDIVKTVGDATRLVTALLDQGYAVVLLKPDYIDLDAMRADLRRMKAYRIVVCTSIYPDPNSFFRTEIWVTNKGVQPDYPSTNTTRVNLHIDNDLSPQIGFYGDDREKVLAHIRTIVEDALGLGGKIPWKKENC